MVYYCTPDKNILGTKLYSGYENRKHLVAICERNQQRHITEYAYSLPKVQTIISNSDTLASQLGETYDNSKKESMRRLEQFLVDHTGKPLPGVKDSGIPHAWLFPQHIVIIINVYIKNCLLTLLIIHSP